MIDDFLKDLFMPDAPAPGATMGADNPLMGGAKDQLGSMLRDRESFYTDPDNGIQMQDQRRASEDAFASGDYKPGPNGLSFNPWDPRAAGGDDGAMLPPGASPMSGRAPASLMPPTDVPMPRARPDIEGILAGRAAAGGPPMGAPPAPGGGGGPMDVMAKLLGGMRPGGVTPASPVSAGVDQEGGGTMARLLGPEARKRFFSSLAGGMKGGNPAFAGGAFGNGLSGSLSGGLKSDKEDADAATAAADKDQKQGNFERQQFDKEKTSEILRKLYGQRGTALEQNTALRAANPPGAGRGNAAWNKPPHERWKDANKLILDFDKAQDGGLGLVPKPEDRKRVQDAKDKFRAQTYRKYGIDENGDDLPSATPSQGSGSMRGGGSYQDPHIPTTQEDFDKVPPGGFFINPADGEILRKKGANQKTSALDDDDLDQDAA